eukprot:TRINITY_DN74590_c0_g1_i1.p1 TRINITY_DN74590_c0_g1~~TRINITY_DN74590_c0_g1_i1.p1  ORF type:complete len:434 (+),score=41.17 TRINITY_DN74590_c0_g1_i1:96-1397(+)
MAGLEADSETYHGASLPLQVADQETYQRIANNTGDCGSHRSGKAAAKNRINLACRDVSVVTALLPHPSPQTVMNISIVTGAKERDVWRRARTLRNMIRAAERRPPSYIYFVLNKPPNCLSHYNDHDEDAEVDSAVWDATDQHRGRTVYDVLPAGFPAGVPHVGRLDRDTEGLLLFTDDGKLKRRMECGFAQEIGWHSSTKTYRVEVAGLRSTPEDERWCRSLSSDGEVPLLGPIPGSEVTSSAELNSKAAECIAGLATADRSCEGLHGMACHQLSLLRWPYCYFEGIEGKPMEMTTPAMVRLVDATHGLGATSWLEIELTEGRNRQIRKLCARSGLSVVTLRRVSVGSLELSDLPLGEARPVSPAELQLLYDASLPGEELPRPLPIPLPAAGSVTKEDVAAALESGGRACVNRLVQEKNHPWRKLVLEDSEME